MSYIARLRSLIGHRQVLVAYATAIVHDELGRILMRNFVYSLARGEKMPAALLFMNGGVRLAVEDSAALSGLAKLVGLGVEILACGTCLDFYKIKDKLAVGRVSNMFEISGLLLEGKTLSL